MPKEFEINLMKCWLFRHAVLKWQLSRIETAELFKKYGLYKFITDSYELLHVSSYECALDELERVPAANGVNVYART